MVVMVAQHYECSSYHWTVHLKMVTMVNFIFTCILPFKKKIGEKEKKVHYWLGSLRAFTRPSFSPPGPLHIPAQALFFSLLFSLMLWLGLRLFTVLIPWLTGLFIHQAPPQGLPLVTASWKGQMTPRAGQVLQGLTARAL